METGAKLKLLIRAEVEYEVEVPDDSNFEYQGKLIDVIQFRTAEALKNSVEVNRSYQKVSIVGVLCLRDAL